MRFECIGLDRSFEKASKVGLVGSADAETVAAVLFHKEYAVEPQLDGVGDYLSVVDKSGF